MRRSSRVVCSLVGPGWRLSRRSSSGFSSTMARPVAVVREADRPPSRVPQPLLGVAVALRRPSRARARGRRRRPRRRRRAAGRRSRVAASASVTRVCELVGQPAGRVSSSQVMKLAPPGRCRRCAVSVWSCSVARLGLAGGGGRAAAKRSSRSRTVCRSIGRWSRWLP